MFGKLIDTDSSLGLLWFNASQMLWAKGKNKNRVRTCFNVLEISNISGM